MDIEISSESIASAIERSLVNGVQFCPEKMGIFAKRSDPSVFSEKIWDGFCE